MKSCQTWGGKHGIDGDKLMMVHALIAELSRHVAPRFTFGCVSFEQQSHETGEKTSINDEEELITEEFLLEHCYFDFTQFNRYFGNIGRFRIGNFNH